MQLQARQRRARCSLLLGRETHLDQLADKLQEERVQRVIEPLLAFLQRVVNSSGRIEREYGLGRLRTDLLVIWPHTGGTQKAVIELKILRKSLEQTIESGLEQTWAYMDRCAADEGHLVIFDRTPEKSWETKIFQRQEHFQAQAITVWGM